MINKKIRDRKIVVKQSNYERRIKIYRYLDILHLEYSKKTSTDRLYKILKKACKEKNIPVPC